MYSLKVVYSVRFFTYICFTIVSLLAFFWWFITFVFAEDEEPCEACNEPPELVQDYFDMMDVLIALIPTTPNKPSKSISWSSIWRETRTAASATEYAQEEIISPDIPFLDTVFVDIDMYFEMEVMQRDYEKTMKIRDKLAEQIGKMVDARRHTDIVPHDVWEKLDKELKKMWFFFLKKDNNGKYAFENDKKTYAVFANFLWRLHQLYQESYKQKRWRKYLKNVGKWFEQTDEKSREKAIKSIRDEKITLFIQEVRKYIKFFLSKSENNTEQITDFFLYIDHDYMPYILYVREIHDKYRCTMWLATNKCNETWQQARKDISYLKKKRWSDAKKAWNTFVSARWRLKWVFGLWNAQDKTAAKQRQQALLHSYRWKEVSDEHKRWHIVSFGLNWSPVTAQWLSQWLKDVWKNMSDSTKTTVSSISHKVKWTLKSLSAKPLPKKSFDMWETKTIDAKKAVLESLKDDIEARERFQQLYLRNQEQEKEWKAEISHMQNAFYDVLALQDEIQTDNVFIDVRRVTQQFPTLSAMVYKNIDIIGDKNDNNKDQDGLYNAMGKVCLEKQCTNLEGKKCRAE